MSDDVKNRINELKEKGYGYKRIAKELSMTASAVRYTLAKYQKKIYFSAHANIANHHEICQGKKKVFCSDHCRYRLESTSKREKTP